MVADKDKLSEEQALRDAKRQFDLHVCLLMEALEGITPPEARAMAYAQGLEQIKKHLSNADKFPHLGNHDGKAPLKT